MELDHLFIRVQADGPEGQALRDFGLIEGSGNRHPGQGTANRRFFFNNAFIELLWIADAAEAGSEQTRPTMLHERLSDSTASPFGVCFRPGAAEERAAFATFDYAPSYLPPGMSIGIASDAPLSEPMWFFLASAKAPAAWPPERRQPLQPHDGLTQISGIRLTATAPLSAAALATGLHFTPASEHLLEISFDNEKRGRTQDFRPHLPLIFKY